MKNIVLFILTVASFLTSVSVVGENTKYDILTKSLPLFRYNMNVAVYKGVDDSIFVVNRDGKIIFKGPNSVDVVFNSNIDFDGNNDGSPLITRFDFNLDGVYPIFIKDKKDHSTYAIDYNGRVVIKKGTYDFIFPFVDGYSRVSKNEKWGIIDVNGKEIVPLVASDIYKFFINHNIWQYFESDSKWHMIDNQGRDVCSFDEVTFNYNIHKALVEKNFIFYMKNRDLGITIVRNGNKWGAVDKTGKIIVPLVNESPSAVYKSENDMWIYYESVFDSNGKLMFSPQNYPITTILEYGCVLTQKTEKRGDKYFSDWNLYDIKGNNTEYLPISENARWHLIGNEWVLEDIKGRIISGPYENIDFQNDCPSKDIKPWIGDRANEFFCVFDDGKAGLIDKTGKFILPMKYSSCSVEHNALKGTIIDGSIRYVAFYDFIGKEIQPMGLHQRLSYQNFGLHYEGKDCPLDAYQVNGKWGLLDMETKKTVVPFVLDDVLAFMNGVGVVKYKGRLYYINAKGKGLPDEAYK